VTNEDSGALFRVRRCDSRQNASAQVCMPGENIELQKKTRSISRVSLQQLAIGVLTGF
jgi:hypothetical protein